MLSQCFDRLNISLDLRPALFSDAAFMYECRNALHVRQYSLETLPIQWERHQAWLTEALKNPLEQILIIMQYTVALGVLRYTFDTGNDQDTAMISIYLGQAHLGKGFGSCALNNGLIWLKKNRDAIGQLHARIHRDNIASLRTFKKAGFKPVLSDNEPDGFCLYTRWLNTPL